MNKLFSSTQVYVGPSKIKNAGRGVFAAHNIKKGELIETCPLIIVPKSDMSNLAESILVTYFFYFGKNKERLAVALGFGSVYNHSYEPNATYKIKERNQTINFTALGNIQKGDEITVNYNFGNPKNKAPLWFEVK
jgi:hypothetical protein